MYANLNEKEFVDSFVIFFLGCRSTTISDVGLVLSVRSDFFELYGNVIHKFMFNLGWIFGMHTRRLMKCFSEKINIVWFVSFFHL